MVHHACEREPFGKRLSDTPGEAMAVLGLLLFKGAKVAATFQVFLKASRSLSLIC